MDLHSYLAKLYEQTNERPAAHDKLHAVKQTRVDSLI